MTPEAHTAVTIAAERHDRLTEAARVAPHGSKLRLAAMNRAALHERMIAEKEARNG